MNGKGDTPRPIAVPPEVLEANWKQTFPEASTPPTPVLETTGDPEE